MVRCMNRLYRTGLLLTSLAIAACGGQPQNRSEHTNAYEVKSQAFHKTLHFTGSIQPLHEMTLTSPMDAVVESMNFHYGQMVHKGDVIMTLDSTDLQKQYNDTLTDYLKAKDAYSVAKSKFVGTQELWDSGLISKNNYLSEKSSVTNTRVTLMQATRKLSELLEKMEDPNAQNITQLSLADFERVKKILSANHHLIKLRAPGDGVLLYPPKSSDDKSTRVSVGSSVKPGQVLALVGDLKGVSVEIDVPEIDIDKIRAGMNATVTGVAFGQHQLSGKVVAVNAQASNTTGSGLPSFMAVVEVSSLSAEQQPWIKVGMSAAIEIDIDNNSQLVVPIAAIAREKGKSVVHIQLAQGGEESRIITTGPAQADKVIVESGLKQGDVVVYD